MLVLTRCQGHAAVMLWEPGSLKVSSNEVLLVIVEEAHCLAQRGNINGMDCSWQPFERFITQSNRDKYCLYMVPCQCTVSV